MLVQSVLECVEGRFRHDLCWKVVPDRDDPGGDAVLCYSPSVRLGYTLYRQLVADVPGIRPITSSRGQRWLQWDFGLVAFIQVLAYFQHVNAVPSVLH